MEKGFVSIFLAFLLASALGIVCFFILPDSWKQPGSRTLGSVNAPVEYEKLRKSRTVQIGSPFGAGKLQVDYASAVKNAARVRSLNPTGFQPSAVLPQGLKLSVSLDNECLKRGRGT